MGLLQIGWIAVATFVATNFILNGINSPASPGTMPFIIVGLIWGLSLSFVGAKGIQYVAKIATYLNFIPLVMLLIVMFSTAGSAGSYTVAPGQENSFVAFTTVISIVIGFFATAGAAGADFGTNARDENDVRMGGLVGITLASVIAAGLPLIAVAGAHALNPSLGWKFEDVIRTSSIGSVMFLLFAVASVPSTCFCAFIAGNSLNTMIPSVPRVASTMCGAAIGIVLAVTGVAANMISFFLIIGASFGPICGAMLADYLLSGKRWSGPREGINFAGYGAWAVGFLVGILPFLVGPETKPYVEPAPLYSAIAGFVVYMILAKAGMQPRTVDMPRS
jgi:cytosine permease